MVQLPVPLLDAVRARLLADLPATPERDEIAVRVISYLRNTAETTVSVESEEDGGPTTTFVITGDIPAMWLRDSAAQLAPLLRIVAGKVGADADRDVLIDLLVGLLRRHWRNIDRDPYANAFNRTPSGDSWDDDETDAPTPWAWERKFELDSLSYGPDLAWRLWKTTGNTTWADDVFVRAAEKILHTVETEQYHDERSPYFFRRPGVPEQDSLARDGRGGRTAPTGLVWSGFRPSDDANDLGYNIPGNHFLALALDRLGDLLAEVVGDADQADRSRRLAADIRTGLDHHGTIDSPDGSGRTIWAYEVDGLGNHVFLDDANVPSLLSLPYLGCVDAEDPTYLATREAVLSAENPYYYAGAKLSGVGSPHTPPDHVWPIGLSIQGLTSPDREEKQRLLETLIATDGGTGMMHEGVHVEDPTRFTREWFSWSNAMFCELALDLAGVARD